MSDVDTATSKALAPFLSQFRCASCKACWLPCHVTPSGYVCARCVWRFVRILRIGLAQLQES